MTNPTQPTPEQLAKWREYAETAWLNDKSILKHEGAYAAYIKGFLFAKLTKQETEQVMKLAKFGAYLMTSGYSEHDDEAAFGLREMGKPLYPNVEATIKELLK